MKLWVIGIEEEVQILREKGKGIGDGG